MRKLIGLFFILIGTTCHSQSGVWTWMKGDSISGTEAHYGIKLLSSPLNRPSALYEASQWTDQNGYFWLYGGLHLNSTFTTITYENVMWRFSAINNEWTWMNGDTVPNQLPVFGTKGIASPANSPGSVAYGSATVADNAGNLWLFGGAIFPNGSSNQLWKYNFLINQWTWMSGDATFNSQGNWGTKGVPSILNSPPSRSETTAAWWENGNIWLYGGQNNSTFMNDLWKYNIATNEWTWMNGDSIPSVPPSYGIKGIEISSNNPGARNCYSHWKDNGNLWIFGGNDFNWDCYSDMWKYSLYTNNWTWMSGSNLPNQLGYYNQYCENDPLQYPAARTENKSCWTDTCGTFWMMGGFTFNDSALNDLWRYYPVTNEWKFVNGDSTYNTFGNYGQLGVPSIFNECPARIGAVSWRSNAGDLWLFGGHAARVNPVRAINDMWRFTADSSCSSCSYPSFNLQASNAKVCPGTCIDFKSTSVNVNSFQWYFPGANPDTSTVENPSNICYPIPGFYEVTLIAGNATFSDTLIFQNYIEVYPTPPGQAITQQGDTLLANQGSSFYQWFYNGNLIPGATDYFYVAQMSGDYNVIASDTNGCEAEAATFNVISVTENNTIVENEIRIFPNPANEEAEVVFYQKSRHCDLNIYDVMGVLRVQIKNYSERNKISLEGLSPGIYFIEILYQTPPSRLRFVKQ